MAKAIRKANRMLAFDRFNYAFITVLCAVFIYPLLLTVSISLSDGSDPLAKISFLPVKPNLQSYAFLLKDARIFRYYANSILYAVGGAGLGLMVTSLMAYPFTVPEFRGKAFLNIYMVITMFFGGGLVPYYYVIRSLGMIDTIWVMLIPGCAGAYNVIIFRTFFSQLPHELRESAYMDGAGNYRILFQIILPMSKPLLATFGLFGIVGKWNDWFTPLLFMRSDSLMPLQILLRRMLVLMDFSTAENRQLQIAFNLVTSRTVKCAAVMITILPILCVYPFLQKYFAKGIMVGALKM